MAKKKSRKHINQKALTSSSPSSSTSSPSPKPARIVREVRGKGDDKRFFTYTINSGSPDGGELVDQTIATKGRVAVFLQAPVQSFKSFFLPIGYPHTVTEDYLEFQIYDTIQAMCSYLRGILCTQAILVGVGVGKVGIVIVVRSFYPPCIPTSVYRMCIRVDMCVHVYTGICWICTYPII